MANTYEKIIYSYILFAILPLGIVGGLYGFATGARRGVTLSEFTYAFVLLVFVAVLAVGAIVGISRTDSTPQKRWQTRSVGGPVIVTSIATLIGAVALDIGVDVPRLLAIGLFWFASAVYILSIGYLVSRNSATAQGA